MKTIELTDAEFAALNVLLATANDLISGQCCNDFFMEDNEGNRKLIMDAEVWNANGGPLDQTLEDHLYKGEIVTADFFILAYLRHKMGLREPRETATI